MQTKIHKTVTDNNQLLAVDGYGWIDNGMIKLVILRHEASTSSRFWCESKQNIQKAVITYCSFVKIISVQWSKYLKTQLLTKHYLHNSGVV